MSSPRIRTVAILAAAFVIMSLYGPKSAERVAAGPAGPNIGNFVWNDLDNDGNQDAGEPGLAGVSVQLWNDAKNALLATATTSASGDYTLVAPAPGDYRVRVLLPNAGDAFSPKDAVGDSADSDINPSGANFGFTDIYTIAANITSIDAGIDVFVAPTSTPTPSPVSIGNLVWGDGDGDGIQDAGEPGLPGISVQLWNGAKNSLIDTDTTDAGGIYTLAAPGPGQYRVRVLLGAGDQFSVKDQGGNDLADSDINTSGADAGFSDVFDVTASAISSIDAGFSSFTAPPPTVTPTPGTPTPPATAAANTSTPVAGASATAAAPIATQPSGTGATNPTGANQGGIALPNTGHGGTKQRIHSE